MKKRKTLILMLSLVCLLVVGIGFAAIVRTLTIDANVTVNPNTKGFVVEFANGEGYTVDTSDKTKATVTIAASEDFDAVGETKTVTLTIANNSTDKYNATVVVDTTGNTNPEIKVENDWGASAKTIEQGQTETVTLTLTLQEAQVETTTFSFTVTFRATAVPVEA